MAFLKRNLIWLKMALDAKRPGRRPDGEFIVAGMATMPSRARVFNQAFRSLIRQVDHIYLYLDGHEAVPEIAADDPRVTTILAEEVPGLHANGKLLGLALEERPCFYVCADDDLYFACDYVTKLREGLRKLNDRAVVGLHGTVLARPLERYYEGQKHFGRYRSALGENHKVDVLGTGAAMFSSSMLKFDVRDWPRVSMTDLGLAIAAAKADIPMISIARRGFTVAEFKVDPANTLLHSRRKDDSFQTELGHELQKVQAENAYRSAT